MQLLESIKKDAIVLGSGEIEVHAFIDPLCKMSQRYLSLIYKRNHEIFSHYTIYLYMHEIKAKKSKQHILTIMDATSPERMIHNIMIDKDMSALVSRHSVNSRELFEDIAKVAKTIGVNKRPYIMIGGKVK
ncbi:MAG: hypothetical protein Q9M36_12305 [Sulfurovum sp.]|nr:hypothetical protein [Sulfurovum sp.]